MSESMSSVSESRPRFSPARRTRSWTLGPGVAAWIGCSSMLTGAAAFAQDADTTLLLSFENSMNGAAGETPSVATGVSYQGGVIGQAALFPAGNTVRYATAGNINALEGTLEFWLRPTWAGGDGQTRTFLKVGDGGGILFAKDGANNLRSIFNRYAVGGLPEMGVAANVGGWPANQWRHVAFSWSSASRRLRLFIDGSLVGTQTLPVALPAVNQSLFQLGADGTSAHASALIDELRISAVERSPAEIANRYLAQLPLTSLSIEPSTVSLFPGWRRHVTLTGGTAGGVRSIPSVGASWSTSNPAVAAVDSQGRIIAVGPGVAALTASVGGVSANVNVTVTAPVRPVETRTVSESLATPMPGFLWEVPVAIIRYLPTRDGRNVDAAVADFSGTLANLESLISNYEIETKFMLEEGSRFRGYASPAAPPSLGYRVVAIVNVYEPLPPDTNPGHGTGSPNVHFPDYEQILTRLDAANWVNDLGVKEVWLWGYHFGNIVPVESNMSSPTTGDVSNSNRFGDDLPIYQRTYTLYNYNFTRTSNESVHNHGHQIEAVLSHVAQRQDGNTDLFWNKFVGRNQFGQFIPGRCGWTHMPPNTVNHYDYYNSSVVDSDIEDWTPAGTGVRRAVNASRWGGLQYAWPRVPTDLTQHQWYIYWMQAIPGMGNTIGNSPGPGRMTNWWWYLADWDAAFAATTASYGLHAPCNPPSWTLQPADASPPAGAALVLNGAVSGDPSMTFRWRRNDVPLVDGGRVSGASTATLRVSSAAAADSGRYTLVATNACGAIVSRIASVGVGPCSADFNQDGGVDGADIEAFFTAWVSGDSAADVNQDGGVDGSDVESFIVPWSNGGC